MERKNRFNRIQETRKRSTVAIVEEDLVDRHLEGEPDAEFLEQLEAAASYPGLDIDVAVTREEADGILAELRAEFHSSRIDLMLNEMRGDVLRAIIGPFGLGRILAAYDKTGGNVDTVHNVRNKTYATTEEKERYKSHVKDKEKRKNFKDKVKDESRKKREKDLNQKTDQVVEDGYTGSPLKSEDINLEHVVSKSELYKDPGQVLAGLSKKELEKLANSQENLIWTDKTINEMKSDMPLKEFLDGLPRLIEEKRRDIEKYESKDDLTSKQEDDLKKLKEQVRKLNSIDKEKARQADDRARRKIDGEINWSYYTSRKFARSTLTAGVNEGAKMGLQQAVGLVIVEFLAAAFDETRLAIASVRDGSKVIPAVKSALGRVKDRILEKWKDVLVAFGSGSLSGFFSSLLTTLINTIVTTSKRVVRLIREGVFSFLKAMKVVLFPGDGVSFSESLHAASKLLLSGVIVVGGVALEEVIEKAITGLVPMSALLAVPLTAAIVGGFTALAIAVACYILDRMDLFGTVRLEEDRFVIGRLDENMHGRQRRWDELVEELSSALS